MAKLIFENLSMRDAKMLAEWYEGQGEQDADVWFECNNREAPQADVCRKGGCMEINKEKQEVKLYLKENV